MKFFIDTANLGEIREAMDPGLIDGVTANPSLIAKEGGVDFKRHITTICEIVKGAPVPAEVTALEADEMLREGRDYARLAPNVVVKRSSDARRIESHRNPRFRGHNIL